MIKISWLFENVLEISGNDPENTFNISDPTKFALGDFLNLITM